MIKPPTADRWQPEIAGICVFLTAHVLYGLFGHPDLLLTGYSKLYISQATLDGVDISKRVGLYYRALIAAAVVFPLLWWLVGRAVKRFGLSRQELGSPAVVAVTGAIVILADVWGIKGTHPIGLFLTLFLSTLVFIALGRIKGRIKFIGKPAVYVTAFIIAIPLLAALLFLYNSTVSVARNSTLWFMVIAGALLLSGYIIKATSGARARRILGFALPIALVPVFMFVAMEAIFYTKMNLGHFIRYKWLFVGLCTGSFVVFALVNWKWPVRLTTRQMVAWFFGPAAVASFIMLSLYQPVMPASTDMFELANPANAQLRLFQFGEIPLVDFSTSHMLSEQFYGYIHNLIFGYHNNLDLLTYKFFTEAFFYLVVYFFALQLFRQPGPAVLVVLAFPLLNLLFQNYLFVGMLAFFAAYGYVQKQTLWRGLLLWLALSFLIAWRLDTGAATLFAMVAFLPLMFYTGGVKPQWKAPVQATALFALAVGILLAIAMLLRSPAYLLSHIKTALHYFGADQAHGLTILTWHFNQQFYLYYIGLPLTAVLAIFYLVYRLRHQPHFFNARLVLSASLFLYLVFLANFPRGLVRHGFAEGRDTFILATFIIATVLLLLSFFRPRNAVVACMVFMATAFPLIVTIKYFPLEPGNSGLENALRYPGFKNMDIYFNNEAFKGKVPVPESFAAERYADIKNFMDTRLTPKQTFLDFSNSPMMYYYCGRSIPSYFCQSLQNTVDDYLQLQHLGKVDPQTVPAVLYSRLSPGWYEATDGVPNAMRYYLIAEYIYANYRPYTMLNGYSIWLSREMAPQPDTLMADPVAYAVQTHNYRKGAAIINRHFTLEQPEVLKLLKEYKVQGQEGPLLLDVPDTVAAETGVFLQLRTINTDTGKVVHIELLRGDEVTGNIQFTTTQGDDEYMVRLSNHYLWHLKPADRLRVHTGGVQVEAVLLYKDLRSEHQATDIH